MDYADDGVQVGWRQLHLLLPSRSLLCQPCGQPPIVNRHARHVGIAHRRRAEVVIAEHPLAEHRAVAVIEEVCSGARATTEPSEVESASRYDNEQAEATATKGGWLAFAAGLGAAVEGSVRRPSREPSDLVVVCKQRTQSPPRQRQQQQQQRGCRRCELCLQGSCCIEVQAMTRSSLCL